MATSTDKPRTRRGGAVVSTGEEFTAASAPDPAVTDPAGAAKPAAAAPAAEPSTAAPDAGFQSAYTGKKLPARKTTIALPLELDARLNALVSESQRSGNPPGADVKAAVVTRALEQLIGQLETEYHKGKPWPMLQRDREAIAKTR